MSESFVYLRNLPVTTSVDDSDTIVVVKGNNSTMRASWDTISSNFITLDSVPSTGSSEGSGTSIAWDLTGVYTLTSGTWTKAPVYGDNWGDLTESTRFLLVDSPMELTDAEKSNAVSSIGITDATTNKSGLVKLADSTDEDNTIPTMNLVREYVAEVITSINTEGIDLSNYQGNINIMGPDGETILKYDSTTKTLTIGEGVTTIKAKPSSATEFYVAGDLASDITS